MKRAVAASMLLVLGGACLPNPVHDRAVERLGPETPNGPSGFHRAGQPCATCHQADGPADTDFSVAGTVFASTTSVVGVDGATILLVDSAGTSPPASKPVVTNCVGNFAILRSDWDPAFPVLVRVTKNGTTRTMNTSIGRAASCSDCHVTKPADPLSKVGPVTLFAAADPAAPKNECPVDPSIR
jgi:hypothetical protein